MNLNKQWFQKRWDQAKLIAGKRYEEALNVDLPQKSYFNAITRDKAFFDIYAAYEKNIKDLSQKLRYDGLQKYASFTEENIIELKKELELTITATTIISNPPSPDEEINTTTLQKQCKKATDLLQPTLEVLIEAMRKEEQTSPSEFANSTFDSVSRLHGLLEDLLGHLESTEQQLSNNPHFLLIGTGGTGKTHLLCEMTRIRVEEKNAPALMFFGQTFQDSFTDPLQILSYSIDSSISPKQFFKELSEYALKNKTRCLIAIDAINEGHRDSWKKNIKKLVDEIKQYKGLALVVSCRIPLNRLLVPNPTKVGLYEIQHYGYPAEQQLEAIKKYFKAYKIPLPEVPLLDQEFSNPLFLKLFCEAVEKITVKKKHAQIQDIASGQRGMTYILEFFIDQKGKSIARQLGIDSEVPWKTLKDGIAPEMAKNHSENVLYTKAKEIVDSFQPVGMPSGVLLQTMINEDILAEDVIYEKTKTKPAIRFTYQRFADHVVARHLLANQLEKTNKRAIKKSLSDPSGLGYYFTDEYKLLKYATIIQALIIEFPTRISNKGELFDYLKSKKIPFELCRNFIEGLYWRDPKSINASTSLYINGFLRYEQLRDDLMNLLTALSVKPKHPFNFKKLDKYLLGASVTQRDLFWSEYLRYNYYEGTPERILTWVEHSVNFMVTEEYAKAYITLLKWFLTSTQRGFRDKVTHNLVRLGKMHPKLLFDATIESLSINDPYVPERMLAASYGVVMTLWQKPASPEFDPTVLFDYAKILFTNMFAKNASYKTTHILSRDYARHSIELVFLIKSKLLTAAEKKLLYPPYNGGKHKPWKEAEDRDKGKYRDGNSPMQMDFENYTLGRLVENRSPYDNTHEDYKKVVRQIFWRIYDLGYRLEEFSEIDKNIGRSAFYMEQQGREASKTDRYGKKYSWIAFYELAGYREDLGLLKDPWDDSRMSDVDIDPSFPEIPSSPPIFDKALITHKGSLIDWMENGGIPDIEKNLILPEINGTKGPWIMLDGFLDQTGDEKGLFVFFRGIMVRKKDTENAIMILSEMAYPGNRATPEYEEQYYSFAGEFPWADTWHHRSYKATLGKKEELEVFVPVIRYAWESYHSAENQTGEIIFPSKEIAESLGLYVDLPFSITREIKTKTIATYYLKNKIKDQHQESAQFIRKDLLDKYLEDYDLMLIMYPWGERKYNYQKIDHISMRGKVEFEKTVHKQVYVYKGGKYKKIK